MLKTIVRKSALTVALIVLTVPTSRIFALSTPPTTPPKVVTGGDPQPTGEIVLRAILLMPSLVVL